MALVPTYTLPNDRYAVMLNANAGRVTPRLTRRIRGIVPPERVHLTQSKEHARELIKKCLEDELQTVFAGGGDGTIVDTINAIAQFKDDAPVLPSVGVLRLGTGNALAHWLGSGNPARDLARWQGGQVHRTTPVLMVQSEETLFPFAGMGTDAAVLNDYNWLKGQAQGRWWAPLARGLPGYLLAGYLKTVPNYLRRDNPTVTVTNLGRPAYRVDVDGNEVGDPIDTGEVIYRGPISMLGCATTPMYGMGMKMFPHATRRAGRFQMRVLNMTALQSGWNFASAWRGTLQHPGLHDFYVDRVRIRSEQAFPYQLGGDAKGYRNEMVFSLAGFPIHLVGQA